MNRGYSNISFGKRPDKAGKNHNATSTMRVVPLAALIAMSPLTTTKAADIMRDENNVNRIELAEAPQSRGRVLLYGDAFETPKGNVTVMALNTKGGTDSYDQILLTMHGYTFEAKELVEREVYLYTGNGGKEGPFTFKEVIGEVESEGKMEKFSFYDPNVVGFVETIVLQNTNQSNIRGVRKAQNNLVIANAKGNLLFVSNDYLDKVFLPTMKKAFETPSSGDEIINRKLKELMNAKELGSMDVEGLFGNYTLKFYDIDGNKNNYEYIYVQKSGEKEFLVTGINSIDSRLHGVDMVMPMGQIYAILLQPNLIAAAAHEDPYIMTDDALTKAIVTAMSSPEYNKDKSSISITEHVSNLAFSGD